MNSLNSILLEGNLTRDPEIKQTPKGTPVCNFSVASNRYMHVGENTQKEVSFFEVETWNGVATRCGEELAKGRGVRVVGRLKQDRWVDADGHNRSKIKIVADHVEFRPTISKPEGEENDNDLAENQTTEVESEAGCPI